MTATEVPVPDWVPPIMSQIANYIADATLSLPEEADALLIRLVTDERMKEVWVEVGKHKRVDYKISGQNFYDVRLPPEVLSWPAMAESWRAKAAEVRALGNEREARQFEEWAVAVSDRRPDNPEGQLSEDAQNALAMATLFCLAVSHFCAGLGTVRRADFDRFIASLRAHGETEKAEAYLRQSAQAANTPYIVTRQRTDARIEAFIKGLGAQTKAMFGEYLYGILATLTNVAFEGTDYDRQRVRALLRT